MTMNTPPFVLQSGSHSAQLFRQAISTLLASAGGVVGANDLLVTQNGTPNMSVNVAGGPPGSGGGIWVPGTTSAGVQGQYFGYQDATVNLAIAAANATNPRIDVVMVQVQDAAYAGAVNSITLSVLTGTPAASPVAPTLPASSLALANVLVPAASTSVVTGNITDKRSRTTLGLPASPVTVVAVLPGSPVDGQVIYFQTANMAIAGVGPWLCRYRAASAFTSKWDVIAGGPLKAESLTTVSGSGVSAAYLASLGSIQAPVAGDYEPSFGGTLDSAGAVGAEVWLSVDISSPAIVASDANAAMMSNFGTGSNPVTVSRTLSAKPFAASATIQLYQRANNSSNTHITTNRWLNLRPLRLT